MKKILFVLHLPPPVHGASVVGEQIKDSQLIADSFDTRFLNLSTSHRLEEIGSFSFRKMSSLFHLLRDARRIVKEWKPNLVYVTPTSCLPGFLKDYLLVRMLKREGCRIIAHLHNVGIKDRQEHWFYNFLYSRFFRDIRVILLSARHYPEIQKFVSPERVSVCPNGIAEMSLPAISESSVPNLLFFSNLLVSKGIIDFVSTCRVLKEKGIPFRAEIAGGETVDLDGKRLDLLLKDAGLDGIAIYHGAAYGAEKAALFARADVFVFPSYREAFGLVALEALSAGLPVVATKVGALLDMVVEGENGFLVEPGDISAMVDRIERLLTDPELRHRMGHAGYVRFHEYYSLNLFEKRITDILADASFI